MIARLEPVLHRTAGAFEVILVDDGSADDTRQAIDALIAQHAWVRTIALMRNYGQHNALLCGIRAARYEHDRHDRRRSAESAGGDSEARSRGWPTGMTSSTGRPCDQQHDPWRVIASQVTRLALQSVLGADTARNVSAFRAFRTHIRDAFADYRSSFVSIDVLLTWGTARFSAVPVRHDARAAGTSHYTFRKLLRAQPEHDDGIQHGAAAGREPARVSRPPCSGSACWLSCSAAI